jgi:hypothetical protein
MGEGPFGWHKVEGTDVSYSCLCLVQHSPCGSVSSGLTTRGLRRCFWSLIGPELREEKISDGQERDNQRH